MSILDFDKARDGVATEPTPRARDGVQLPNQMQQERRNPYATADDQWDEMNDRMCAAEAQLQHVLAINDTLAATNDALREQMVARERFLIEQARLERLARQHYQTLCISMRAKLEAAGSIVLDVLRINDDDFAPKGTPQPPEGAPMTAADKAALDDLVERIRPEGDVSDQPTGARLPPVDFAPRTARAR